MRRLCTPRFLLIVRTILTVNKLTVVCSPLIFKVGGWGNPPEGPPSGRGYRNKMLTGKVGDAAAATQAQQLPGMVSMFFGSTRVFISCRDCGHFFPFFQIT